MIKERISILLPLLKSDCCDFLTILEQVLLCVQKDYVIYELIMLSKPFWIKTPRKNGDQIEKSIFTVSEMFICKGMNKKIKSLKLIKRCASSQVQTHQTISRRKRNVIYQTQYFIDVSKH